VVLLVCKSVLINRRSGMVLIVACETAYHTSAALNQYIARRSQDFSGHPQGESNEHARRYVPVSNEENTARGNIHRRRCKFLRIR